MPHIASPYIGRFAPTPSGALHFGSLVAALASYLDAKAAFGLWKLRMEDLDKPREVPGAADAILRTLEAYGLEWDGPVVYQSQRTKAYQAAAQQLIDQGQAYYCTCSRKQLEAYSGAYPGFCRHAQHPAAQAALRVKTPEVEPVFEERLQNLQQQISLAEQGDFIVCRRDGIFAYQLAVVVDDAWQGVTDVVRGADLLESTPRQHWLQSLLHLPHPRYLHLPLAVWANGQKLSKSDQAPSLSQEQIPKTLCQALRVLGQTPPADLPEQACASVLDWATQHWDVSKIPSQHQVIEPSHPE